MGNSDTNPQEQQWYVPYKNYILTKLKLFKGRTDNVASGFEVTYSPDNKDMTGWPEMTQLFGNKGENDFGTDTEEIEFSQEIKAIEYCIDKSTLNEYSHDLEGFRFTLYDDQVVTLATRQGGTGSWCKDWFMQDLGGKRLIGFRVVEADYLNFVYLDRNIREI